MNRTCALIHNTDKNHSKSVIQVDSESSAESSFESSVFMDPRCVCKLLPGQPAGPKEANETCDPKCEKKIYIFTLQS